MLLFLWLRRPRHRIADTRSDLVDVPVAIEGLAKEFKGGLRAVDGITYQVPKGKVIGLLGPNGAGKTTTMRMVLGLILPTEGDVFVFGERVTPGNPVLSRIERAISPLTVHIGFKSDLDLPGLLAQAQLTPLSIEKVSFPKIWSLVTCIKG